jgi:NAD(P)-dependent dehydrogenase (short-subunit alcohol dehydrogenase family)
MQDAGRLHRRVHRLEECGGRRAGASAYASAKAAANHLARCLALEGAPARHPRQRRQSRRRDQGQPHLGRRLAQGARRRPRDRSGAELEEHYRKRSMLKRDVLPEDIAEACTYWLASDMSAKSTGNMINVDAGNAQAFTRCASGNRSPWDMTQPSAVRRTDRRSQRPREPGA